MECVTGMFAFHFLFSLYPIAFPVIILIREDHWAEIRFQTGF